MLEDTIRQQYEAVIGLEVHAQLSTDSKAYSNDKNEYGECPNSLVSVISMGHPGTLPKVNKKVVDFAIRLGLACDADIRREMYYARKNYFYPDLPKGYQITQDTTPICNGGFIRIEDAAGKEKRIHLTRIHMEEDAGKSIHDQDPFNTLVDLNRAGVPLLEIVSEPEIKTSQEAYSYLQEVRKLVRYLDICDGNMEEGSLRCDANVSVMKKGAKEFGTKVEVKNMNSIRNVQRAIEHEIERQILALENGEKLYQETRNYDAVSGTTSAMRTKEAANDYRYFPEPDLPPLLLKEEDIETVREELPPLPYQLLYKYTKELGLSQYDARNIIENKSIALFYEDLITHTKNYKSAANWLMGDVKSYLNEKAVTIEEFPVPAVSIAALIGLIDDGKINNTIASQKIFPKLLESPEKKVQEIAEENNWILESNSDDIRKYVEEVIEQFPDEAERFRNGEKKLTGFFMGQIMKASKGKADPKQATKLINEILN